MSASRWIHRDRWQAATERQAAKVAHHSGSVRDPLSVALLEIAHDEAHLTDAWPNEIMRHGVTYHRVGALWFDVDGNEAPHTLTMRRLESVLCVCGAPYGTIHNDYGNVSECVDCGGVVI